VCSGRSHRRARALLESSGGEAQAVTPIPKSWQARLRQGARARLRGSIDFEHTSIPVELAVRLDVDEQERVSVHVTLPVDQGGQGEAATRLTPRERKVVSLIGMGNETDEIARRLFIAPATVRTHVRNAMSKVDAHTRAQLVARVYGNGEDMLPMEDDARGE
jgi:DNA-binding NarL/FixJ family response regulator